MEFRNAVRLSALGDDEVLLVPRAELGALAPRHEVVGASSHLALHVQRHGSGELRGFLGRVGFPCALGYTEDADVVAAVLRELDAGSGSIVAVRGRPAARGAGVAGGSSTEDELSDALPLATPVARPAPAPVSPSVAIAGKKTAVVPRAYLARLGLARHRLPVLLSADAPFDGTATLRCNKPDCIKLFDAERDGAEQTLPLTIEGARLTGKTLYVEAAKASGAPEDIELTLSLAGGSKPVGPPATDKMTAVELELGICKERGADGGEPAKLGADEKIDAGRVLLVQKRTFSERARLVVSQAKPASYTGKVKLVALDARVALHAAGDEVPALGQTREALPLSLANDAIPGDGSKYWVEGIAPSAKLRDSGFRLELEDAPGFEGDRVHVSVLRAPLDVLAHRLRAAVEPAALGDDAKIDTGRVLHVQKQDKHGRAKIVVRPVEPAGFAGKLVLRVAKAGSEDGAALKLYRASAPTTAVGLPFELEWQDGMPERDRTFLVEGVAPSDARCDLEVRLGVKDVDRGGDRVAFTVVEIAEVKPAHLALPGASGADYDGDRYERYVNCPYDATSPKPHGRTLKVRAKLSKPLAGVRLRFMLVPHEDNGKAAHHHYDLPGSWTIPDALRHGDNADPGRTTNRSDPAYRLHTGATTDVQGVAEHDLVLSTVGGDVYFAAAYLDEEPEQGKFEHGHPVTGSPKLSRPIRVWRKLWAQMTKAQGGSAPAPGAAVAAYEQARVRLVPTAFNEMTPANVGAGVFYPKWMLGEKGPGDLAVIGGRASGAPPSVGNGNKASVYVPALHATDAVAQPNKLHVVVCDRQYDLMRSVLKTFKLRLNAKNLDMGDPVVAPALGGGLVKIQAEYKAADGTWTDIPAANVTVREGRSGKNKIDLVLPPGAPAPRILQPLEVRVRVRALDGPYLGESPQNGRDIIVVYDGKDVADYNDTIAHEIGHTYAQTPRNGTQPGGLANHPKQVDHGQGNHCTDKACLMYESGPQAKAKHVFCQVCHPYVLGQDFAGNIPR